MRKIINIIMIGFFSVLSINNEFGICLCLPVLLILLQHNYKNIIITIPLGLLSSYIFKKELFVVTIILYIFIILLLLMIKKKNKIAIIFIIFYLFEILIYLYLNRNITIYNTLIFIVTSFLSFLIYYILDKLVLKNYGNYYYFEMIAIFICIISISNINAFKEVSLYLSVFYVMYFSLCVNKICSYAFSFGLTIILFMIYKEDIYFILPIINSIYLIGNIASSFILVILIALVSLFYPENFRYALVICIICIIFEMLRKEVYNKNNERVKNVREITKEVNNNINKNLLAFSTFLDSCTSDIEIFSERENNIKEGINNIKTNYCIRCHIYEKCNKENINKDYDLNNLIINCHKKDFNIYNNNLLSKCPYNIEIRKSALITNSKINFNNINNKNKIIKKILSNISSILRQYTIENEVKEEIDYKEISKIKENIMFSGYDLCYFNVKSIYVDSFLIEIGIRGVEYNDVFEKIKELINKTFKYICDIEYMHNESDKMYFKVFRKNEIKLQISTSNIASGSVSGDNIYIKEKENRMIASICDGMGKGNKANNESSAIIRLFDQLSDSSISTYTSIQILNSYQQLKEQYESFSTIDFLDIDMRTRKAIFFKMAAAPSYIFKANKKIEKIDNVLLPLGNEEKIEGEKYLLNDNDLIIMSSDGFFENVDNEDELTNFILNITHLPVDKIVLQLLNYVNKKRINNDDLSIIVIKILGS